MPSIKTAAPQFLVNDLDEAIAFYKERLGFTTDFVYGDFYAGVSRDGAVIHLKCAPKLDAERTHRKVKTSARYVRLATEGLEEIIRRDQRYT